MCMACMEKKRDPKGHEKAWQHHEKHPHMVVQQESSENELNVQEAVKQRIRTSKGWMTVHRIDRMVREEILARELKIMQKKRRPATGGGSIKDISFEPVVCTQAIPEHDIVTDASSTGFSKLATVFPETQDNSGRGRRFWWPTKFMRRLACRMGMRGGTEFNKIHNLEAL